MIRRVTIASVMILALTGCERLPWTDEAKAAEAVRQRLSDPASAQFRNLRRGKTAGTICGEVNSKNRLGGYVGFLPFVASETEVIIAREPGDLAFQMTQPLFCEIDQ